MSGVRLLVGDAVDVLRGMRDCSVDHVITDPPYLGARGKSWEKERVPLRVPYQPATKGLLEAFIFEAVRVARKRVLVFNDYIGERFMRECFKAHRDWVVAPAPIVWVKPPGAFTPNGTANSPDKRCEFILCARRRGFKALRVLPGAFVSKPYSPRREILRTGGKPEELMTDLVRSYTDEGDSVVDPFCGAGTTGVACISLPKRKVFLSDCDHEMVAQSARRIGPKAVVERGR